MARAPRKASVAANPVARNTVTVACKIPSGLVLRLFRSETYREQGRAGEMVEHQRSVEIEGTRVTLKGANSVLGLDPKLPSEYAYGLTHGVPEDIWDQWLVANADSDVVRQRLVYAHAKPQYVADKATEQAAIRTGFEPINPDKPWLHQPGIKRGEARAA